MLTLLKKGEYKLIEIDNKKAFRFDGTKLYVWELSLLQLSTSVKFLKKKAIIVSQGKFFLYNAINEQGFTNGQHFEIVLNKNIWQGYLLPAGFPTKKRVETTIVITNELITRSLISTNIHTTVL